MARDQFRGEKNWISFEVIQSLRSDHQYNLIEKRMTANKINLLYQCKVRVKNVFIDKLDYKMIRRGWRLPLWNSFKYLVFIYYIFKYYYNFSYMNDCNELLFTCFSDGSTLLTLCGIVSTLHSFQFLSNKKHSLNIYNKSCFICYFH